jgi:hypothetical protein
MQLSIGSCSTWPARVHFNGNVHLDVGFASSCHVAKFGPTAAATDAAHGTSTTQPFTVCHAVFRYHFACNCKFLQPQTLHVNLLTRSPLFWTTTLVLLLQVAETVVDDVQDFTTVKADHTLIMHNKVGHAAHAQHVTSRAHRLLDCCQVFIGKHAVKLACSLKLGLGSSCAFYVIVESEN